MDHKSLAALPSGGEYESPPDEPEVCWKNGVGCFVVFPLLGAIIASLCLFPILMEAVPRVVWNSQFRDSCYEFETRVQMDYDSSSWLPASSFTFYKPAQPNDTVIGIDQFDLIVMNSTTNSSQEIYRLQGSLHPNQLISVDFNLIERTWQMLELLPNTTANTNSTMVERFMRAGSWTNSQRVPRNASHVTFPELNLEIPDMAFFDDCHFQPFMKVYRTDGMTEEELKAQRERKWSSNSEDNVVMRTASFGHGYHGLELCARRKDYTTKGNGAGVGKAKGLGDDMVIPLGFMAALRKQMRDSGNYKGTCSMRGD